MRIYVSAGDLNDFFCVSLYLLLKLQTCCVVTRIGLGDPLGLLLDWTEKKLHHQSAISGVLTDWRSTVYIQITCMHLCVLIISRQEGETNKRI